MKIIKIVKGTNGNDILIGEDGSEIIIGSNGSDVMYGGDGDDLLLGGNGNDELYGQGGNDILHGGAGNDTGDGGANSDIFLADGGNDTGVYNYAENKADPTAFDYMHGGSGTDTLKLIFSTAELASLGFGDANQAMQAITNHFNANLGKTVDFSQLGFKLVVSSFEKIEIKLDDTPQVIEGTEGDDQLNGGVNNETFVPGAGNDVINAGGGTDTLDYSADTSGVAINLLNNTASGAQIGSDTYSSIEIIKLGSGDNTITAPAGTATNLTFDLSAGGSTEVNLFAGANTAISLQGNEASGADVSLVFNTLPNAIAELDFENGVYSFNPTLVDLTLTAYLISHIAIVDPTATAHFKSLASRDVTVKTAIADLSDVNVTSGVNVAIDDATGDLTVDRTDRDATTKLEGAKDVRLTDRGDTLGVDDQTIGTASTRNIHLDMGDQQSGEKDMVDASQQIRDTKVTIDGGDLTMAAADDPLATLTVANVEGTTLGAGDDEVIIKTLREGPLVNAYTASGGDGENTLTVASVSEEQNHEIRLDAKEPSSGTLSVAGGSLDYDRFDKLKVDAKDITGKVTVDASGKITNLGEISIENNTEAATLSLADSNEAGYSLTLAASDAQLETLQVANQSTTLKGFKEYELTQSNDKVLYQQGDYMVDGFDGYDHLEMRFNSNATTLIEKAIYTAGLNLLGVNFASNLLQPLDFGALTPNVLNVQLAIQNMETLHVAGTLNSSLFSFLDVFVGNYGNDMFIGGVADNIFYGSVGFDAYVGSSAGLNKVDYSYADIDGITANLSFNSVNKSGNGVDQLENIDTIIGTRSDDVFVAGDENIEGFNNLNGYTIDGDTGHDILTFDSAATTTGVNLDLNIVNISSIEEIHGSSYGDNLNMFGSTDNPVIYGGDGNDTFIGNSSNNTMYGEAGNDAFVTHLAGHVVSGTDYLDGGEGYDLLEILAMGSATGTLIEVQIAKAAFVQNMINLADYYADHQGELIDFSNVPDFISAYPLNYDHQVTNFESLVILSQFNNEDTLDIFVGSNSADEISGSFGPDLFKALGGDDVITGYEGNDKYEIAQNNGHDTITDFSAGDKIDLTAYADLQSVGDLNTSVQNGNTTINLDGGNSVTLQGVTTLVEDYFIFS